MWWNMTSWTFPAAFSQINILIGEVSQAMSCSVSWCTEAVMSMLTLQLTHRKAQFRLRIIRIPDRSRAADALWHVKQSGGDRTLSQSWMTLNGFKSPKLSHTLLRNSIILWSVLQFYSLANESFSYSRLSEKRWRQSCIILYDRRIRVQSSISITILIYL